MQKKNRQAGMYKKQKKKARETVGQSGTQWASASPHSLAKYSNPLLRSPNTAVPLLTSYKAGNSVLTPGGVIFNTKIFGGGGGGGGGGWWWWMVVVDGGGGWWW
jgi:hypothetical protein